MRFDDIGLVRMEKSGGHKGALGAGPNEVKVEVGGGNYVLSNASLPLV